jgi:hypothetical protein
VVRICAFIASIVLAGSTVAHADVLSLDAARAMAEKGDMATLMQDAEILRFGWVSAIVREDIMQLVDTRAPPAQYNSDKNPLTRHSKCVARTDLRDLVTRALAADQSKSDPLANTFPGALSIAISNLCPFPSLEINPPSQQAWILVLALEGAGGSHLELGAQATTNGHAFLTLASCQATQAEREHNMTAQGIPVSAYGISCIQVFK